MSNDPWLGYPLGKYRIQKFVAQTRSSLFYLGLDEQTNESVAIKLIPPDKFSQYGGQLIEILLHNTQVALQIKSPHVVSIYFGGMVENHFCVVMQFVPGISMAHILAQNNSIMPKEALLIAQDIAKALHVGHSLGMLHLDVKPANILLTDQEQVKLAEFGLSMPIDNTQSIVAEQALFGHPWYISPEEICCSPDLDARSDLYSLGATLFHLMSGHPPYEGDLASIFRQHVEAPIPSLRQYLPNIPEPVEQLVGRLLAKRPQDRFSSAQEVALTLQNFLIEVRNPQSDGRIVSDVPLEVEEFLLEKIALGENEHKLILNTLNALSEQEKKQNLPEEARELMEQIIVQEFMTHFHCDPGIIQKIKNCHTILQNPNLWLDTKLNQLPQLAQRIQSYSTASTSPNVLTPPIPGHQITPQEMTPMFPAADIGMKMSKNMPPLPRVIPAKSSGQAPLLGNQISGNIPPNAIPTSPNKLGKIGAGIPAPSERPPYLPLNSGGTLPDQNIQPIGGQAAAISQEISKVKQQNTPTPSKITPELTEASSRIIKASQKMAELMGSQDSNKPILPSAMGMKKGLGASLKASRFSSPLGGDFGMYSPFESKSPPSYSNEAGRNTPPIPTKTPPNLSGKLVRWLFVVVLLCGMIYGIYIIPGMHEKIAGFIQEKMIDYGIIEPKPVISDQPQYPNLEPTITKLCQQKQFNQARLLIRKTDQLPEQEQQKLINIIQKAEGNILKKIPPGIGWFGERMPYNLECTATPGEYLWKTDDSLMVFVPAGEFMRGTKNASYSNTTPQRLIQLDEFYIDKYEVTNRQYSQFTKATGYSSSPFLGDNNFNGDEFPVVGIKWSDASNYAKWAGKKLPTEAQWEKAYRGGMSIPNWQSHDPNSIIIQLMPNPYPERNYPWGNESPSFQMANYKQSSAETADPYNYTAPIGAFPKGKSPYLCEDMLGNVMEWCNDFYSDKYYSISPSQNPPGPPQGTLRVCRGGDWETEGFSLLGYRRIDYPNAAYNTVGFRLVKTKD